jgi:hypothetical protein
MLWRVIGTAQKEERILWKNAGNLFGVTGSVQSHLAAVSDTHDEQVNA